jgi:hypothetical protein
LLDLLGTLLVDPLRFLLGAFVGGLAVRPQPVRQLADLREFGLGCRPPFLVGLLLVGAPRGQLHFEVAQCLGGLFPGLDEHFLRLGLEVGRPLRGGVGDRLGLLLG